MAFFNFVDQVGPAVPASYLNALDNIRNAVSANTSGNVVIATPSSGDALTVNGNETVNGNLTVAGGGAIVWTVPADSVIGNPTNAAGVTTNISASADGQVLRRAAGALAFGALAFAGPALTTTFTVSGLTAGWVLQATGAAAATFQDISANPTGTIGLTAVNGTATTFIRSDGAPALSQAIVPTWTGIHTFSAFVNIGVASGLHTYTGTVNGAASGSATTLQAIPVAPGAIATYLVAVGIATSNDTANYSAQAVVSVSGSSMKSTTIQTGALMTITASGNNIQATQGSGAAANITYSITKVA